MNIVNFLCISIWGILYNIYFLCSPNSIRVVSLHSKNCNKINDLKIVITALRILQRREENSIILIQNLYGKKYRFLQIINSKYDKRIIKNIVQNEFNSKVKQTQMIREKDMNQKHQNTSHDEISNCNILSSCISIERFHINHSIK